MQLTHDLSAGAVEDAGEVPEDQQYLTAEEERKMKLQDVLLKAMAKKITWWDAAEIIGVCDRTMRRWRERLEEHGYSGLADRRKGKLSGRRVALATAEQVLGLYQKTYYESEHPALSREVERGPRDTFELYLGATGAARSGLGGARAEARDAPASKRTAAVAGYAAAH